MKKAVTHTYETAVCDICGAEEDIAKGLYIEKCSLCGIDMCSTCKVNLSFYIGKKEHITFYEKKFCKKHLPELLLNELTKLGGMI